MLPRTFVAASPRRRILLPDLVVANRRQLFSRSTSDHARPATSFNREPVNASTFTIDMAVGLSLSIRASSVLRPSSSFLRAGQQREQPSSPSPGYRPSPRPPAQVDG